MKYFIPTNLCKLQKYCYFGRDLLGRIYEDTEKVMRVGGLGEFTLVKSLKHIL